MASIRRAPQPKRSDLDVRETFRFASAHSDAVGFEILARSILPCGRGPSICRTGWLHFAKNIRACGLCANALNRTKRVLNCTQPQKTLPLSKGIAYENCSTIFEQTSYLCCTPFHQVLCATIKSHICEQHTDDGDSVQSGSVDAAVQKTDIFAAMYH